MNLYISLDHPDIPNRMGVINNIEKFDADFFELSFDQAHTLGLEMRMLLEHSFEAIIDAGINPRQLRGKNTAVIVGASFSETQIKFLFEDLEVKKIIKCNRKRLFIYVREFVIVNFLQLDRRFEYYWMLQIYNGKYNFVSFKSEGTIACNRYSLQLFSSCHSHWLSLYYVGQM